MRNYFTAGGDDDTVDMDELSKQDPDVDDSDIDTDEDEDDDSEVDDEGDEPPSDTE